MANHEGPPQPNEESEYVSAYAQFEPSDPEEAERAGDALAAIMDRYVTPGGSYEPRKSQEGMKTMMRVLTVYSQASIRAAANGLEGEDRVSYIKSELKQDALIDPEDEARADVDYGIISAGYDLNAAYFDMHLGRARRFRQDIRLLDEELGNQ